MSNCIKGFLLPFKTTLIENEEGKFISFKDWIKAWLSNDPLSHSLHKVASEQLPPFNNDHLLTTMTTESSYFQF